MYPSSFEYHAPTCMEEALDLLSGYGEDAKVLAGGQSLLPLLKMRLVRPRVVIDINNLPGLDRVQQDADWVIIGSLVRHFQVEHDPVLARYIPWLREVVPLVADRQVRSLGTIAGTLVEADPAGDWSAVFLALEAEIDVIGLAGTRSIRCRNWFEDSFTPALAPDEIVVGVRVRKPDVDVKGVYVKLEKRVGDFAVAGCAVVVQPGIDGVAKVGVGLTGVGPVPAVPKDAVSVLNEGGLNADGIRMATAAVREFVSPIADMRGSVEYKRNMAGVAFERAVRQIVEF